MYTMKSGDLPSVFVNVKTLGGVPQCNKKDAIHASFFFS
ncbi:hypothetical protein CIN_00810 [Commensalibacter intestini A911]|uniref:Uncharacterized protein n=1 Tax=Commensalibacter intestini A911 TaxID=1088868 RepID=G6EZS6_9PROT|nr:hypothetical protein CIN_00810 [Commensalibacter intestini A911]